MPDSDHVTKFQGDRSRKLGERVAKKTSLAFYKSSRYYRTGGLIIIWNSLPKHVVIYVQLIRFKNNLEKLSGFVKKYTIILSTILPEPEMKVCVNLSC